MPPPSEAHDGALAELFDNSFRDHTSPHTPAVPLTIQIASGDSLHLYPSGDGFEAEVDRRGVASRRLPVFFGPGFSPSLLLSGAHVAPLRHVQLVPLKGAGDSGARQAVYVGRPGLPGGGGGNSKAAEHDCGSMSPYRCEACGFQCPNNACYVCCTHKDHSCAERERQQDLEREAQMKRKEETLLQEIQREMSSFRGKVRFENFDDDINFTEASEEVESSYTLEYAASEVASTSDAFHTSQDETPTSVPLSDDLGGSFPSGAFEDDGPASLIFQVEGQDGEASSFQPETDSGFERLNQDLPPEEMERSLLQMIVSKENPDCMTLEKFREMWLKVMEKYDVTDRVQLLKSCIRKSPSAVSLIALSNALRMALDAGEDGWESLEDARDSACLELRKLWLRSRLEGILQLSSEQRGQLGAALASTGWSSELCDFFLQAVADEPSISSSLGFVSHATESRAEEALILPLLLTDYKRDASGSKLGAWTSVLRYHMLLNKVATLSPEVARASAASLFKLTQTACSSNVLYDVVSKNIDTIKRNTSEFVDVLNLLFNYSVKDKICESALARLGDTEPESWLREVDKHIVRQIFRNSQAYQEDELMSIIVKKSPGVATEQELRSHYGKVREALCSGTKMTGDALSNTHRLREKAICTWSTREVEEWGKAVRKGGLVDTFEAVAVVVRAVQLQWKFSPRPSQILTLIILLHPAEDEGRLAQVNTGEGKSLIVAMFAAIHALRGKQVDVITTSTELSVPESKRQAPFYRMLGISVGENSDQRRKEKAYRCDVVYGTSSDFQADLLRKEFLGLDCRAGRGHDVVVVDEVDSMLFDNRSWSVRLSQQIPGMHHLELVLGAIWERVHRLARHLIEKDGTTFFIPDEFEMEDGVIKVEGGVSWDTVATPVNDRRSFIIEKTEDHLKNLLRDLDDTEKAEYEDHRSKQKRIAVIEEETEETEETKKLLAELQALPWNDRYPIVETPSHLRKFARRQAAFWIKNAIDAAWSYKKDAHYTVQNGRIVPIHYNENGVLQPDLVWSDGLTQFLQIKEGLAVDPEGISTNFISNVSFFRRYGSSIYGLTGTLGEEATQNFLSEVYKTDMVIIPPFTYRAITDNDNCPYLCKELCPVIVAKEADWYRTIASHALFHARQQRAVLLICKYIYQVKHLEKILKERHAPAKVFPYTGESDFGKTTVESGDIVIATNIAGRGTDLKTSNTVERHGGLYVGVTFLPGSYRVELQNVGRTAREGKKGMAQLIVCDASMTDIEILKKLRREQEVTATNNAMKDAKKMLIQDRLFSCFCSEESRHLPTMPECEKAQKWDKLIGEWEMYQSKYLTDEQVAKKIVARAKVWVADVKKRRRLTVYESEALKSKVDDYLRTNFHADVAAYRRESLEHFCRTRSETYPADLLECLLKGEDFNPLSTELARKYCWGPYERRGLEERWGLWLKSQHLEARDIEAEEAVSFFDSDFKTYVKRWAEGDKFIENPYYYVLKGNEHLHTALVKGSDKNKELHKAVEYYDRAIDLDPTFCVNARYNKACALLSLPKHSIDRYKLAIKELEAARDALKDSYFSSLMNFHALLAQTGVKEGTVRHIQHQMNVVSQQQNYIEKALEVAKSAVANSNKLAVHRVTVKDSFSTSDEDHSKAVNEAIANGLTHFFALEEKRPVSIWSVVGLVVLGVVQVVAGSFLFAVTRNSMALGLVAEGISDVVIAFRAATGGAFSWAAWGVRKAASLAVSLMSAGWRALRSGATSALQALSAALGAAPSKTKSAADIILEAGQAALQTLENGPLKECLSQAGNWKTTKTFFENMQKDILPLLNQTLGDILRGNKLVKKALFADNAHGNKHWQRFFFETAIKLLQEDKQLAYEKKIQGLLEKLMNGTTATKSKDTREFMTDLVQYTTELLKKFTEEVQQYEEEILRDENESGWLKKKALRLLIGVSGTSSDASAEGDEWELTESTERRGSPPADGGDTSGQDVPAASGSSSSRPRASGPGLRAYKADTSPSSVDALAEAFSNQMCRKLFLSIESEGLASSGKSGGSLTSDVLRECERSLALMREKTFGKKGEEAGEGRGRAEGGDVAGGEPATEARPAELSDNAKRAVAALAVDLPETSQALELLAALLGRPILVFRAGSGELIRLVQGHHKGKPVMLKITKPLPEHPSGKCEPLDSSYVVERSGLKNCFVDAVWAQLSAEDKERLKDLQGLRMMIVEMMRNNPDAANKLFEKRDELDKIILHANK